MVESDVPFQSANGPLHLTLIVAIIYNAVQVKRSHSSTYKVAQMYELVAMEGHRI
jgi:hypothetical protein